MTHGRHPIQRTPTAPQCLVCTTPTRCGTPALHTKGPRCVGKADGMDDCDCLNACGDDPWIESGRSMPCEHRRETKARLARIAGDALDAARLQGIAQAIRDYHFALDTRQHGGVAQDKAFRSIVDVMGMHWVQGAEAAARAAQEGK